jgi:radical SAM protein with 4Fe4S-binding SPASM domain
VEVEQVLRDLQTLGAREVVFLGGEPLLHPDWERCCQLTRDLDMAPLIVTNGTLVDDDVARRCVRSKVDRVGVSIDASDADTHDMIRAVAGSHARAWNAVHRFVENGVTCTIITTVTKLNFGHLVSMRDQIAGRGLGWQLQTATPNGARFRPGDMLTADEFYEVARFISTSRAQYSLEELPIAGAHDIGYNSRVLKNYAFEPRWHGCQGGISTVGIQSNGWVKPCLAMPETYAEGDVRAGGGLIGTWRSAERFLRNRRFSEERLQGGCRGCEHGATCRAGCPDVAWNLTGSGFDNPHCLFRIENERG